MGNQNTYSQNYNNMVCMLDNIEEVLWIKDNKRRYRFINKAFEKLFQINKADVIGKTDSELDKYNLYKLKIQEDKVVNSKKAVFESQEICIKDKRIHMHIYMWPLYASGDKSDWIGSYTKDISIDSQLFNYNVSSQYKSIKNKTDLLLRDLKKQVNGDGISFYIFDNNNQYMQHISSNGVTEGVKKFHSFKLSSNIKYNLLETKIYENVTDIAYSDFYRQLTKYIKFEVKNLYVKIYSIVFDKNLIGTINVFYKNDKKINEKAFDLVKSIYFKIVSIYIMNILLDNLQHQINTRLEKQNQLESLLNMSSNLYGILDINKDTKEVTIVKSSNMKSVGKNINLNEVINKNTFINNIRQGKKYTFNYTDSSNNLYEFNCNLLSENRAILTGRDRTLEERLEENNRILEEKVELECFKRQFFANLSHEFKTPLNIIITGTQLLLTKVHSIDNWNNDEIKKYTKLVKQNCYRLLKIINNLIDVVNLKDGTYNIQLINSDLVKVVEDIVTSFNNYAGAKKRKISFATNVKELIMSFDPEKIERIILNILSNAIKYTEENGKIDVGIIKQDESKVILSLKNDGIPIDKKDAEKIFDRFSRIDSQFTRLCEGSGIGLSLVKSLVELHCGKIYVNTEYNDGTEFIIELPIKICDENYSKAISKKISMCKIDRLNIEFSDIYSI